ncbi:uncharacterized protein LOC121806255 isoform X1 [Salvia splendens]|uniref:uncharacterized protein LOC121806255 isoform X1 n=1 Tax=Salvia splendens TaxID=180675 RepID=UPI0011046BFE|nr:uncharacterized protein LOC121806255 isoform X1 [Salvia splendens]
MALSRLLQPNSTIRTCRLGYSAATAKFCSSGSSDGDGGRTLQFMDEAVVEDTKIMLPDIVSEAVAKNPSLSEAEVLGNIMAQYSGRHKTTTLSDIFTVHESNPTETTARNDRAKNLTSIHPSHEPSNQPCEEDAEENPFQRLVQTLSIGARHSPFNPTELSRSTCLAKGNSSNADVQGSDKYDRSNLLTFPAGTSTIEVREINKLGFDLELKEQKNCLNVLLPTSNNDQMQRQTKNLTGTESEEHKVLVRFLQSSVSESALFEFFKNCGEILNIECRNAPRSQFKTASINFKTRDGLQKALSKSGMYLTGQIVVEPAAPGNRSAVITVPALLGDPDIPAALVKNPTRTIRIEQLTEEICSHNIVEALAFCQSKVSSYFLGPSPSVAYVELETETGKERALAKQSINVLGRHLIILRIDCPRTTAVRITSSRFHLSGGDVTQICRSLGDVSASFSRDVNVLDVHFKVSEWPNMVKILNSLNGCVVKGSPVHAEPAPVFPPEVLLALWHNPLERKHLKATAQALLLKLKSKLDTSELDFLENNFFSIST